MKAESDTERSMTEPRITAHSTTLTNHLTTNVLI
jgi:hypothetical protein